MKKIAIDTMFQYKFVSNPSYSPDGKYLAFVVQSMHKPTNGYMGNIHLLEVETGKVRQLTNGGDGKSYCWSAANTILFPATRCPSRKKKLENGENLTIFYEISPEGGEAVEAFCLPVRTNGLQMLSPDVYALTSVYDNNYPKLDGLSDADKTKALETYIKPPHDVFEELPFWSNGRGVVSGKRTRLYIYNAKTDKLEAVTDEWFDVESVAARGDKVIYKGGEFPSGSVRYVQSGIYVYDVAKKKSTCILKPNKMKTGMVDLFDENTLICAATDGKKYGTEQYCDFYTVELKTKKFTKLADYEATIGASSVGSDCRMGAGRTYKVEGGKLYFITTIENSGYLRTIDKKGKIEDVYAKIGTVDSFDVYKGRVIFNGLFGNRLGEVYDVKGNQLTHFNDEIFDEYSLSTPVLHKFTATDGFEIHGWAMKPIGYKEGKKYPAILNIHGGPRTVFGDVFFNEMQYWANEGYFVFFCNPRSSDGRGNEFGYISGKYGTVDYDNIMDFCDEMLKQYPDVDEARFGVTGGSYGGFMSNWIIGHTDRFAAAAPQRSISNWISFENTTDIGYFFTPNQHLTTTQEDAEKLWWHSPLKYAKNVKTPTLFIHSDSDYRCYMVEGLSMFTALKMNGVESRMVLFKGENHELSRGGKPLNRVRRIEEITSWMNKYLKK